MRMNSSNVKRLFFFLFVIFRLSWAQIAPQKIFPAADLINSLDIINADSVRTVSFSVVGDLMCHSDQFRFAMTEENKFDFKPVFENVKNLLSKNDYTLGNLETVTAGDELGYGGYPKFNTPDEYVEALAYTGFDILFTANNHALDQGEQGVKRTIEIIRKYGMKNVGTSHENETNFLLLKKNGLKFAVLAYTYGTNGFVLPDSSKYRVNIITRKNLRNDLSKADSLNPDFIIVYFHYGTEYSREPDAFQKDFSNYALRYGADIVIGSHPHVIQTVEHVKSKRLRKSINAYSLGNFVSNQRWRYSDCGIILNFTVEKNVFKNKIWLDETSYVPIWVYKGTIDSSGTQGYRIYAMSDTLTTKPNPFFNDEDLTNMNQSFLDTKEIIGNNIKLFDFEQKEQRKIRN